MAKLPYISIVIPIYNNSNGLSHILKALKSQKYPANRFEIIVVDNDSSDNPEKIVNSYPNIHFLKETRYTKSPYSARNRGIEVAKGEIIALLDSTCKPCEDWLLNGTKHLKKADLIGGKVIFDVTLKSNIWEIYDSVSNIKMKESIERRGLAVGCNLFIKTVLFNELGLFEEGLRSGGDLRWTKNATLNGYLLKFADTAIVTMKPKNYRSLLNKTIRVATGQPKVWLESGTFFLTFMKRIILFWVPPNPIYLSKNIRNSSLPEAKRYFFCLYCIRYFFRLISVYGFIKGLLIKH
ncbi:glycosyltransferase [Parapedobacter koreensis]|uniref:Glycosyl transferase family 2 n=1 Tax=Parapedobacter koreensis TaxID=332977 RepID=A0A1H7T6K3_9SPHI|nr:glycosyltransferase [Parapedobacter koreensis]SEL80491.1 Glycosyl transferase family 2 [Parapedobacter koreensis]